MRVRNSLLAIFIFSASRGVMAQRIAPAAAEPRTSADSLERSRSTGDAFTLRSLTGALGFVAGVAGGLTVAAVTGPHDCGGCDDPGLAEALTGATLGGAIGAALGASIPKLTTRCGADARFGRALAGSLVGTVLGVVIGVGGGSGGLLIVSWPAGTVLGASALLIGC